MTWEGIHIEDGLFDSCGEEDYIAGMFAGPWHQEVGGKFRRDGIAGAFGAKPQ